MNRTDKQELARRLEAIMSDLRYATDLATEDFEQMTDELYDMGASILDWVGKQDPKEKRFNNE